jgi:hypothetical protein
MLALLAAYKTGRPRVNPLAGSAISEPLTEKAGFVPPVIGEVETVRAVGVDEVIR